MILRYRSTHESVSKERERLGRLCVYTPCRTRTLLLALTAMGQAVQGDSTAHSGINLSFSGPLSTALGAILQRLKQGL